MTSPESLKVEEHALLAKRKANKNKDKNQMKMIYNTNDNKSIKSTFNDQAIGSLRYGEKQRKPETKKNKGMMSLLKSNISRLSCHQRTTDNEMATLLAKMEESNLDMKLLLLEMQKNNELSEEEIKKTYVRLDDMENKINDKNVIVEKVRESNDVSLDDCIMNYFKLDSIQKSQQNIFDEHKNNNNDSNIRSAPTSTTTQQSIDAKNGKHSSTRTHNKYNNNKSKKKKKFWKPLFVTEKTYHTTMKKILLERSELVHDDTVATADTMIIQNVSNNSTTISDDRGRDTNTYTSTIDDRYAIFLYADDDTPQIDNEWIGMTTTRQQ